MSITYIWTKIKSKIGIDINTLMLLFVIAGVGVASFGLGVLSGSKHPVNNSNNFISENEEVSFLDNSSDEIQIVNNENIISTEKNEEKMYVASKNGKLYYSILCNGAKKIKEENKVWFASSIDAEKSGYSYASSCK